MAVVDIAPTPAILMLPVEKLTLGLDFRVDDDGDDLADLAMSIAELGVLQALVVRQTNDGWEVIAGRRRLAAARIAGMTAVPCVLRALTDDQAADIALAENLHRRDLSPVEVALAFKRLADQGLTQTQIAERVGRSQGTVSALLRLLEIPAHLRDRVHRRDISYRTALDLAGRRSYTKHAGGDSTKATPPPEGWTADVVTHWRQRHDRLIAGLQRIRTARADGMSFTAVLDMVERLLDLDAKTTDRTKARER